MIIPVIRNILMLVKEVEEALERVYRYQKQLKDYSARTTSTQRRADVEAVLDELNEYAVEFAKSGVLKPCSDIRVIFGLWSRLDTWHDFLRTQKQDDYLILMDEHNTYENGMAYLLQPRLIAEGQILPRVLPKERALDFLDTFANELQKQV